MASAFARIPAKPGTNKGTRLEQILALACFAGLLAINIALINLRVANFPVRAFLAIGLLGAVGLFYPDRLWKAIQQHALVLWLALGLALLGAFASLVIGASFNVIWQGIMEVPFQVAVTLLVASVLAQIVGSRKSALAFVTVVAFSAAFAVLQFLGAEFAWGLREWLGSLQIEPPPTPLVNRRPMGLSFSPIQLSTQLCLAFAVYAAFREQQRQRLEGRPLADPMIFAALLLLLIGSMVTLTRSPILGGLIFFLIYAIRRPGSWLLFLALLGATALYLIGPLLMESLQANVPRVVRTDDASAYARISMNIFGLLLFADNPLGYGFGFTPSEHWAKFWQFLYYTPNPSALKDKELHNYALNMLNTYGIGLLLVVPLVAALLMRGRHAIIFFVPYIVHIAFHNSGPFWNDVPFWFAIAALSAGTAARPDVRPTAFGRDRAVPKAWTPRRTL